MESNNNEAIISLEVATEYGFIEKLCATFGFIKCLNKDNSDKRLFFHSSEVKCGFDDMKIGDCVSFTRGTKNGKSLAKEVFIRRKESEREDGTVERMPKKGESGSICYQYNEECFYISFNLDDLMELGKLKVKDAVTFERKEQDGVSVAFNVCKKYNKPMRMQGIVSSIKDKYGFINRCDVVKEIYFNVNTSAVHGSMAVGTHVEFNVKHLRNGKEEAVNLRLLEAGKVRLADVFEPVLYGTLLRCPELKRGKGDDKQLTGNISYACASLQTVVTIPFSDQDQMHGYSLHPGDIVGFQVAVDLRDQLHRACSVHLCLEKFPSRKEMRHNGVVWMYDASAGLIEPDQVIDNVTDCGIDSSLVTFKYTEWLVPGTVTLAKYMAVSYTPIPICSTTADGQQRTTVTATRLLPLRRTQTLTHLRLCAAGSLRGTVTTEATTDNNDIGYISEQLSGSSATRKILFTATDVLGDTPTQGHKVSFGCLSRVNSRCSQPPRAFAVKIVSVADRDKSKERRERANTDHTATIPSPATSDEYLRGWVVIMREDFGFVETSDHGQLYKFGRSTMETSGFGPEIGLGSVVEFSARDNSGRRRMVLMLRRLLSRDSLPVETVLSSRHMGTIEQAITITEITHPDCQYHGVIVDCDTKRPYPFTMTSLAQMRTKVYLRDRVMFTVTQMDHDSSTSRATDVILMRQSSYVTNVKDKMVFLERCTTDEEHCLTDRLPSSFKIDYDQFIEDDVSLDDMVELDLDLDKDTKEVIVIGHKLIKSSEPSAIMKGAEEVHSRILHWREPRLPERGKEGFSDELKRVPALSS